MHHCPGSVRMVSSWSPETSNSAETQRHRQLLDRAVRAHGLDPATIDRKFQFVRQAIFNRVIGRKIAAINPQLQQGTHSSPYAAQMLAPFLELAQAPRGEMTYNDFVAMWIRLFVREPDGSARILADVGRTLLDFNVGFEPGHHAPKKRQWEELDAKLATIEPQWAEIHSWRDVLREHRNPEGIKVVLKRWHDLTNSNIAPITTGTELIGRALLEASDSAFAKYVHVVDDRIHEFCSSCHRGNDLTGQTPFVRALRHCSRCRAVMYCSQECQRADWPRHRVDCVSQTNTQ